VLHRRNLLDHWIANPGIEITRDGGKIVEKTVDGLDVEYWTDDPPPAGEGASSEIGPLISNIIIATKADAALPQADHLRRYLGPSSTVAFAQNGISKMWPPHGRVYASHRWPAGDAPSFVACITTHGVLSHGPFRSEHASVADAKIGLVMPSPMCPRGSEYLLNTVATAPGLESRRVSRADLWVLQLEKLVVNSIINPITAILRCKNGVLFAEPSGLLVEVMNRVLQETSRVYQALVNHPSTAEILMDPDSPGHSILGTETKGLDAIRKDLTARFAVGPLRAMLWRVGHQVSLNTSSMLQDVRAGRRTEIREFNGWIVDTAHFLRSSGSSSSSGSNRTDPARCQAGQQQQGLDVSTHRALIDLVESGRTLDESELGRAISG
jgi:2-dehydropantoate 2-reductase